MTSEVRNLSQVKSGYPTHTKASNAQRPARKEKFTALDVWGDWTVPREESKPWEIFRQQQATLAVKAKTMRTSERDDFGAGWTLPTQEQPLGKIHSCLSHAPKAINLAALAKKATWGFKLDNDVPDAHKIRGKDDSSFIIPRTIRDQLGAGPRRNNYRTAMVELPEDEIDIANVSLPSCPICLSDDVEDAVSFQCKKHYYCCDCVQRYLLESIAKGRLARCMADSCGAEIGPDVCRRVLTGDTFDRYLLVQLRNSHRLKDCPACEATLCVAEYKPEAGTSQSARCPNCYLCFCSVCGCEWHPQSTCDEATKKQRLLLEKQKAQEDEEALLASGFKKCPRCAMFCEKSDEDACDHMTCVNCKFEFCWLCMADRKVIYAHGNHYHVPGCKYHFAYDAEPEFIPNKCSRCKKYQKACIPPEKPAKVGRSKAKANKERQSQGQPTLQQSAYRVPGLSSKALG